MEQGSSVIVVTIYYVPVLLYIINVYQMYKMHTLIPMLAVKPAHVCARYLFPTHAPCQKNIRDTDAASTQIMDS
jgi:hypothetical protein